MKRPILLAAAIALAAPPLAAQQMARNVDLREWPVERGGRSRDPYVAPDGKVWFVGQAGNYVANLDPATGAVKHYEIEPGQPAHADRRRRRHGVVRGQPQRPHRPTRPGHR